jgi:glycosyltransferase involved in cell wall biosynthesis
MKTDPIFALVIIPTFNREDYLSEAVDSVLAQDYAHKKILIVDDGSTDGTRSLCQSYVARHPTCLSFRQKENGGCSTARNLGLDLMDETIGYVCFLDSDDRLLPGKLSREINLLHQAPSADFTYSDSLIHENDSGIEHIQRVAGAGRPSDFALEHFLSNNATPAAILYRAKILRSRRFREDFRYNEDSEFLQRVAIECQGVYSPEPGCWMRRHAGSKSRNTIEILKAVLRSSTDILSTHPDFHRRHRSILDKKIKRLRRELFMELLINERWDDAADYVRGSVDCLSLALRVNAHCKLERLALRAVREYRTGRMRAPR